MKANTIFQTNLAFYNRDSLKAIMVTKVKHEKLDGWGKHKQNDSILLHLVCFLFYKDESLVWLVLGIR